MTCIESYPTQQQQQQQHNTDVSLEAYFAENLLLIDPKKQKYKKSYHDVRQIKFQLIYNKMMQVRLVTISSEGQK